MPPKKEKIDSKQPTLNLDSIRSILERLSLLDFHRARCVSSEWYFASKSCNPKNPLLILFQNNGSCELFDPRDDNTYKVRDGYLLATSFCCLASSGDWFLMLFSEGSLLLLNLFARETIPLPSLISNDTKVGKAVLWVDEKTRDYLVVWYFDTFLAYHKKGDSNISWKLLQPLKNDPGFLDMVLKETKLYVFTQNRNIFLVEFSGHDDDKKCEVNLVPTPLFYHRDQYFLNLAVNLSGEVLIIASHVDKPCSLGICFFDVYKMDPKSSSKWCKIKSIGDEVLLLDLGITVEAKDRAMRNCIYFSDDKSHRGRSLSNDDNRICVYHIQTDQVIQRFQNIPMPLKDVRWFLPTFGGNCLL